MAPGCGAAAGSAVGGAERGYAATRLLRREMCRRTRFRTFFLVGAIGTHLNPLEEHAQEQLLPGLLDGAIDRPAVRVPKMGEQHGVARSVQTLRLQCPADPQADTTSLIGTLSWLALLSSWGSSPWFTSGRERASCQPHRGHR
jgi:hypothetical protein